MSNDHTGGWIRTYTGRKVCPFNADPASICIEDIAHALSNICRWTGHTKSFYSVAQHSLMVAYILPQQYKLWGLLHDATEAYLSDLNRPVKHFPGMEGYREAEYRLMGVIAAVFNLEWPEPSCIKDADNVALVTEARDLMGSDTSKWGWNPPAPLRDEIIPVSPEGAERWFLDCYKELTEAR